MVAGPQGEADERAWEVAPSLLGLTERDAQDAAVEHSCAFRVVGRYGLQGGVSYRRNDVAGRLNVILEDGRVVGVNVG